MADIEKILEKSAEEVVPLTQKLIRFPSVNKPPYGQEGKCQEFVASWMKDFFDEVDVFEPTQVCGIEKHPSYWPGREYSGRPNVVGKILGKGIGKSLLFNGHVDVVPDDPKPWKHNPFGGDIEDGKIYGRGGLDMKGGLAAAMIAAKIVKEAGIDLDGDVIIESVVDEEFAGANGTLACVLKGYTADAAISMEPTWMEVGTTMRSGRLYEMRAKGIAGMPFGISGNINPAYLISRMALGVDAFDKERNKKPIADPLFKHNKWPLPALTVKLKAGQAEPDGLIGIPDQGWLHAWIYGLPNATAEQLDDEVQEFFHRWVENDEFLKANKPKVIAVSRFLEGSSIPQDHPFVKTLKRSASEGAGKQLEITPVDVTGDNGLLVNLGKTPTVCLGPGGGDSHASDEYVNIEDLIALVRIYAHTIVNWCKNS